MVLNKAECVNRVMVYIAVLTYRSKISRILEVNPERSN